MGCHPIHLIQSFEQKYDLSYKAAAFGLTKIVSGLWLELSNWVNEIFYFFLKRATWFDLQGCIFWSHKDCQWAVTGIIKLIPLNGNWRIGLTWKASPFDLTKIMIGFFAEFSKFIPFYGNIVGPLRLTASCGNSQAITKSSLKFARFPLSVAAWGDLCRSVSHNWMVGFLPWQPSHH